MGRAAATVAVVSGVVLLVYYALLGFLGTGPVQTGEVPLWLRSIETGAGIFQTTATGLALIIGGLFAYYRFFKEETYSPRIQPSVAAVASRKDGLIFIQVTAAMTNPGQTSVWLDMNSTRLGLSTRKARIYGWEPSVVEVVFTGNDHIRPGETIGDQVWMEIPDDDYAAILLELRIAKVREGEEEKILGWIARDIVNLVEN